MIVIPDWSGQMKLTMISNLVFFNALFKLVTWLQLSFINFGLLLLFIGTMTCFLERPFVVIVRLTKFRPKFLLTFLVIFLLFYFLLSSILRTGVRVLAWHHCHNCYKSHDTVILTVTGHNVAIEGSKRVWKDNIIQYV